MNHFQMIDAVNDATTVAEHDRALCRLAGWRTAAEHFGGGWSGMEADLHFMEEYGEGVPMCCGVRLDWTPADGSIQ